MNKVLIFISILLLNALALAGNSTNNGGNLIPAQQVPAQVIADVLSKIRLDVRLHLNYASAKALMDNGYFFDDEGRILAPIYSELFSQPVSIFQLLRTVKVGIKLDGPCLDEQGQEADASSIGETPDSICVSVPRLQLKVTQSDLWHQALALVAHEYAHRAGFNEEKAVELQRAVLDLVSLYSRTNVEAILRDFSKFYDEVISYTQNQLVVLQGGSNDPHALNLGHVNTLINGIRQYVLPYWLISLTPYLESSTLQPNGFPPFAGLNGDEFLEQQSTDYLQENIKFGLCSIINPSDLCKKELYIFFQEGSPVNLDYLGHYREAYVNSFNGYPQGMPATNIVYRLFGQEDCNDGLCESKTTVPLISTLDDVQNEIQRFIDRVVIHKNDLEFMLIKD